MTMYVLMNKSLEELIKEKALRPTAVIEALNEFYENGNNLRKGGRGSDSTRGNYYFYFDFIRNKRWDNDTSWDNYYFDKNDLDKLISYLRAFDIFYTPDMSPVVKQFSKAFYVEFKAPAPAYPATTLRPRCEGLSAKTNYVDTDILSECAGRCPCVNPCVKEKIEKEYDKKIVNNMITELRYLDPSFKPEWINETDKNDPVSLLRRVYGDYKEAFNRYKARADDILSLAEGLGLGKYETIMEARKAIINQHTKLKEDYIHQGIEHDDCNRKRKMWHEKYEKEHADSVKYCKLWTKVKNDLEEADKRVKDLQNQLYNSNVAIEAFKNEIRKLKKKDGGASV